jgi:alpha-beta hydrolase superfamily lysophospholipase
LLPRPIYFGPDGSKLFGWFHGPGTRTCGVVLCPPMGYEAICSHRALRHLAERLARAGFPTLRFDYHGTGDSMGSDRDPGRVRAWFDSIGAAIDTLKVRAGVSEVCLFGVRLGATLAGAVAAERGDVARLVLWAPCPTGRAYVREMRAFRLMQHAGAAESGTPADEEAAGFLLTSATVSDLGSVSLLKLPAAPAKRILLLSRDDMPAEDSLVAKLSATGAQVEHRQPAGYADMMQDPHKSAVPDALINDVIVWLGDSPAASVAAPAAGTAEEQAPDLGSIREQPVRLGEGSRLFGILAEPTTILEAEARRRPAVILLNAGAVHRVGSNRMYVSMARTWAERGFTVLRLDVAGIGDSPPAAGQPENLTYSKTAVSDVQAAMAHLRATRGVSRFVLAGLCSGAYVSFHAALQGGPVVGCVLINPQTFYWHDGDSLDTAPSRNYNEARHYQRSLLRPEAWMKALRGQVDLRRFAKAMATRAKIVTRAKIEQVLGTGEDVGRDLRSLCDRNIDTLLVFSEGDPGIDYLQMHARRELSKLRERPMFRFRIIADADHTFTPVATQGALVELLTDHLVKRYA